MSENMTTSDTLNHKRLDFEDIEFLKTSRRTFESMSMGNHSRAEGTALGTYTRTSNEPRSISTWRADYKVFKVKSEELKHEINNLRLLFERIGGDQTSRIIEELKGSRTQISSLDKALLDALNLGSDRSVAEAVSWLISFRIECRDIEDALYSHKHAFNFVHLRRLKEACETAEKQIDSLAGTEAKLSLIFNDLVPRLAKRNFLDVIKEFRTFSTKILPSYVIEEEERATTQYLALTTIATFFSSITATTLQFSYQQTSGGLSSAVNLFWFVSLVFSVSSGINSLLSMIWRKSIVFSKFKPPKYINFWLTKAPIAFLVIAAFAFVVGLNLFPYSSHQHIYVSSATNFFTVLHVLGLLIVTSWYLVKMEWSTYFVQHVRRHILWVLHHDDKVLPVNTFIAIMAGWPEDPKLHPHPIAKFLRHCVTMLRYFIRKSKDVPTPINIWAKQHVLQSLAKLVKGLFKLMLTASRIVKLAVHSSLRRLKHVHSRNSNPIFLDPEVGVSAGKDEGVLFARLLQVDRAVDDYISSLDKTFAVQYHQPHFRNLINDWKSGVYNSTDAMDEGEKSRVWGYPALYRQFAMEVLPVMRSVDELRFRSSHMQQQPQDSSHSEGFGPPNVVPLPPASFLRSEGEAEDEFCVPLATGVSSDLIGGRLMGVVSLDGDMNNLDQNQASMKSTADPLGADGDEGLAKAPSPPLSAKEEQASNEVSGKSWVIEKARELSQARTQHFDPSPIPPEIEMKD